MGSIASTQIRKEPKLRQKWWLFRGARIIGGERTGRTLDLFMTKRNPRVSTTLVIAAGDSE